MCPFCSVCACKIAKINSCLRILAAPSMLKFLPISAKSLIFFSLRAFRFNPFSSTASGSAIRVLPRTINYASPFTITLLKSSVGHTLLTCCRPQSYSQPYVRTAANAHIIEFSMTFESSRNRRTFADTTCQCDRLLHADTDFFFKFRTDVAKRFFQCGGLFKRDRLNDLPLYQI